VKLGQKEPRGAHKVTGHGHPPWARPVALSPPRRSSGLLPKLLGSLLSRKKSSKSSVVFGLRLVLISWKTKNRQKTATGTGH
jgi:hypothetical protein